MKAYNKEWGLDMKLLIVDDEPIIRMGIKRLIDLEALGISELIEAENGEKGYELFKTHQPEIVLADINMPKMNGLDFARRIKIDKPDVKIAMITGYDYFEYAQKALKIGVEDYILKPVSKNDIQELILKLVNLVREEYQLREVNSLIHKLHESTEGSDEAGYKELISRSLEAHMTHRDFSLSFLAAELGLSVGYLSGLFKKLFGVTFKEYVLTKRLNQAKIMLLTTDLKNYEISEAIGITDPNYFSAVFKKRFGYSPNQFREKARDDHV
jgi:two-component system response regulator YesN